MILALRLLALGLLALAWAGPAAAGAPPSRDAPVVAIGAEIGVEGARTRLSVVLSGPVEARAFLMERPDRVIVDLPEVNFQVPQERARGREGLIASYRFGLFAPGRSRLVIDLERPATVARVEVAPRAADGASILTVELVRAEREAFRRAAAQDRAANAPPPPAAAEESSTDRRPVIVLDPGHGGVDPGATAATGDYEKDIVFAFAQKLRTKLQESGRYRVVMTRTHDVFVPLDERVRLARSVKADLFISIHADSIRGAAQVRGLSVYTGAERASDTEAEQLAARENQADAAAGVEGSEGADEVADILRDLMLRETRTFSQGFAKRLVGDLDGVAPIAKRPHRQARFRVLRAPDVPSVLVELGYLSSKKDIDLLTSEEWRDKSAGAMAGAVDRYFATRMAIQGSLPAQR